MFLWSVSLCMWYVHMCVCVFSHSVISDSLWPHGLQPARLLCPWGFSGEESWSGLPCPPPGDLPNPGIEPSSPTLQVCRRPELPGKPIFIPMIHDILDIWNVIYTIYQFSSVAQSCPTLCDPMNCSTPGLPVHHQLPEFTQTHVHWVSDAIQPSHLLSSPSPLAPNPSQHQSIFQWVNSSHEVAKVLEFQL